MDRCIYGWTGGRASCYVVEVEVKFSGLFATSIAYSVNSTNTHLVTHVWFYFSDSQQGLMLHSANPVNSNYKGINLLINPPFPIPQSPLSNLLFKIRQHSLSSLSVLSQICP